LRAGLALAGVSVLSACGFVPSQRRGPARIPRIGYLAVGAGPGPGDNLDDLRQGAAELGYVEGGNLAIEARWGFAEQLPALAAELVGLRVELIVTQGGTVNAAKEATATIPIVVATSGDPVAQGLASSLARPGGNITGLTTLAPTLGRKRLELLKETAPEAARVAVLWNPNNAIKVLEFEQAQAAARALGLALESLEVRGPADFDNAFNTAAARRFDGLDVLSEGLIGANIPRIADFALGNRVPSVFEPKESVAAGGLISYGPNFPDLYRRAAAYVDKILKGAKPADLPIEQPTRFDFAINIRTAQTLGLTIPPGVLAQATEVLR
jgi:putative ABC transport system substrate-binding protein